MISLSAAAMIVVYLIVVGLVFGLLFWLVQYCSTQFPMIAPFAKVANVILAILAVLVLIGLLLQLTGHTVFIP